MLDPVISPAPGLPERRYDLGIATVGYEARSTYVASVFGPTTAALEVSSFPDRRVLSYERNRRWFKRRKTRVQDHDDAEFRVWIKKVLAAPRTRQPAVWVDISCLSRSRIAAAALEAYAACAARPQMTVDFLYAPAVFSPPPPAEHPITVSEVIAPELAGWWPDPQSPAAVVVGLGYEVDKAVGALEFFEAGAAWAFVPRGEDPRYDKQVEQANKSLWTFIPKPEALDYSVSRPFECFQMLESLTFGLLASYRPILVPFGPKLFALTAILVGRQHQPSVSVWRISSGTYEPAVDRRAAGSIAGLRLGLRP